MVQDRWPSQDKVDPNTSVNGNLDTLHEAIVVNNVKSLLVEKNLTDLFVSVDKVPLLSNIRNLLVSISPPCLTERLYFTLYSEFQYHRLILITGHECSGVVNNILTF